MASRLQKVVVQELTSAEARHHERTAQQDPKIDRLKSIVEKMATSTQEMLAENRKHHNTHAQEPTNGSTQATHQDTKMELVFSPAQSHNNTPQNAPERPTRSPRESETPTDDTTYDGCASPDRQKQKPNPGVSAQGGNETRVD
jgi:hypothetical protein